MHKLDLMIDKLDEIMKEMSNNDDIERNMQLCDSGLQLCDQCEILLNTMKTKIIDIENNNKES